MALRSPICVVVGHVDHGKSSILDYVRGTNIVAKEAGAITQAIGASTVPLDFLQKICGQLLKQTGVQVNVPGLLFIDTPGHAAFTSMRERGGSLADIAILVININEGIKPQTEEAIKILREHKTPFVIAANKVDLISGFQSNPKQPLIANLSNQPQQTNTAVETKLYELIGFLYDLGLKAERFDRVKDFTQEIALIPTSALKGDGMPELLMVITVLAQKYLEKNLQLETTGTAKGTVLEVKEQQGLGKVMDTIIYDGTIRVNDTIVIGHVDGPITTKVRALFVPSKVADMRDSKTKFTGIKEATAATGVRIAAPDIDKVISGMPIETAKDNLEEVQEKIKNAVQEVTIESDEQGIIVKADTLGGVEALLTLLKEEGVPVRKASIGEISKKDLLEAKANLEQHKTFGAILGFNVKKVEDKEIKIICEPVIYKIIEDYLAWKEEIDKAEESASLDGLPKPCKIEYLKGHTFRQSHPAIIGIAVHEGTIKKGAMLMKDGQPFVQVKGLQNNNDAVEQAVKGEQVAMSIEGVTAGRQIQEGNVFYSFIDEEQFRELKEKKQLLKDDEIEALKEIAVIMREENPVWGI